MGINTLFKQLKSLEVDLGMPNELFWDEQGDKDYNFEIASMYLNSFQINVNKLCKLSQEKKVNNILRTQ